MKKDEQASVTWRGDPGLDVDRDTGNLRHLAMVHYCFEHPGVSIAQMAAKLPFNAVSRRTLENWSSADRWADRRRRAEEEWTASVQKKMGDAFIQKRIAQLDFLENLESKLNQVLASDELSFRSLEGAITAFVRLARFIEELREKIVGGLVSARPGSPGVPEPRCIPIQGEERDAVLRVIRALRAARGDQQADQRTG